MSTTQTRPSGNGTATQPVAPHAPRLGRSPRRPRIWLFTLLALVVIGCGVAAFFIFRARLSAAPAYQTQTVTRATLVQTVTASGTVNPQDTVSVGTQISGTIDELDVDYNSRVHVGQVLAKIDPSSFQAAVNQAQAQLAQAQAQQMAEGSTVGAQQSTFQSNAALVAKAQSTLTLANQTVARDRQLIVHGYIAASQLDTDIAAQATAQAGLISARDTAQSSSQQVQGSTSTEAGLGAAVQAAQAQLQTAQVNLQRTIITSPVNGIVIARNVSIGQTVASSFTTPTLFLIAKDLSKMEVDLSVGEPDIGHIRPSEALDFTVLAYPNNTYHGVVSQVRENPTTVSNVVTYTVVSLVNNVDGTLLPGMTANASLHVGKAQNSLIVPLQALQFRPGGYTGHRRSGGAGGGVTARQTTAPAGASGASGASAASPWGSTLGGSSGTLSAGGNGMLFVDTAGKLAPVRVHIDLVQGTQAAVTPRVDGALKEGDQVVLSDASQSAGTGTHTQAQSPLSGAGGGSGGLGRTLGR